MVQLSVIRYKWQIVHTYMKLGQTDIRELNFAQQPYESCPVFCRRRIHGPAVRITLRTEAPDIEREDKPGDFINP